MFFFNFEDVTSNFLDLLALSNTCQSQDKRLLLQQISTRISRGFFTEKRENKSRLIVYKQRRLESQVEKFKAIMLHFNEIKKVKKLMILIINS